MQTNFLRINVPAFRTSSRSRSPPADEVCCALDIANTTTKRDEANSKNLRLGYMQYNVLGMRQRYNRTHYKYVVEKKQIYLLLLSSS